MTATPPAGDAGALLLWIDGSAGVAGDMLLGALVDAGADLAATQAIIDAALPATVRLEASEVARAGLRALKVEVHVLVEDQPHRTWRDIRALLAAAEVPDQVRDWSLKVFGLLADAEAHVHGVAVDDVHFHEVGAWDSIADIVGVAAALHLLGVGEVSAGAVALGSGRTRSAHGDVPVPAPATLQLASGWAVRSGGDGELATPTGMALIRGLAVTCEELPALKVTAVGVGAGSKDTPGRPNVVRVVAGPAASAQRHTSPVAQPSTAPDHEQLWVLEANIDDLDPRVWPEVLDALLAAGAADAWLTPIVMKKGRPAHTLSLLCSPTARAELRDLVFTLTTTFGIREYLVERAALDRDWEAVVVRGQTVRIKFSTDADGLVRHATPEFDDAAKAARETGLPVRQILDEASSAALVAGIAPGRQPPPP